MEEKKSSESSTKNERPAATRGETTMHDHIGYWCDCCSCEAEPQWQEVAEKLGIDLSGREDVGENGHGARRSRPLR